MKRILFNNISTKQTVIKNTFWLFISECITKGSLFLISIIIATYLGVEGYGRWIFAFTFVSVFTIIADMGISTLMIREIAKNRKLAKKYLSNLISLKIILGCITLAALVAIAQLLGKESTTLALIYLIGIYTILNVFNDFLRAVFRAFEQMQYEAYSKIIGGILLVLFVGVAVHYNLSIICLLLAYIISAVLSLAFTAILVKKDFLEIHPVYNFLFLKRILKKSWPFAINMLLGIIYFQIDTIQVNLIAGDAETGIYAVAYNFVFILLSLSSLVYAALYPALSRIYAESKEKFYRNITFLSKKILLYSILICLVMVIAAKFLILTLYGDEFYNSYPILIVLIISTFFLFTNTIYSQALLITNRQKEYSKTLFIGVFANFALNFIFIYYFNALGAAITTLFSSLLITIMFLIKFRHIKKEDLE